MSLKDIRRKIDLTDKEILKSLNKRASLILSIAKIKKKKDLPIYTPSREKEVYEKLRALNKGPIEDKSLKAIYREIMSSALNLEKPMKVTYLGPKATFTQMAAIQKFGESVDYIECKSISDVFTEVERGRADYGVVPIENSIEGAVNHTLDMFIESELRICSEIYLPIRHHFLSKHKKLSSIKKVYSHQQVFAQCRMWLEKNLPNAKLISCASTTDAAWYAKFGKGSAAIASKLAAEEYRLRILARSIEDSSHNVTRFLIIGEQEANPSKDDKTSIVFSLKDKVGVLHDALVPFKKNGINLTKIESRPSKRRAWKYYFFVDLEGHIKMKKVQQALKKLEKTCKFFKILGSYPVSK